MGGGGGAGFAFSKLSQKVTYFYMFYLFKLYLSVFFVFHGKNLVLLNLINIYVTSTSQKLLKSKYIAELC